MSKLAKLFLSMSFITFAISSCVKTDIDEPPYNTNYPSYNANFSIKELKDKHTLGGYEAITEDYVIKAVVVADDKTGNFYKTLVIQDSTAGIDLRINATNLFNIYPIGRRIYLKVKGLTIGDYNGNLQIGAGTYIDAQGKTALSSIEEPLLDNYIIKGEFNIPIVPAVRTLAELGRNDENTLVQINGMEVADADLGKTYAEDKINSNRTFKDCSNNTATVRTSGYATFALKDLPQGNGTMLAVYTVFGTTKQLLIRDTSDLQLTGTRCGGGGTTGDPIDISALRAIYQGTTTTAPADKKIKGIVISDKTYGNITPKNIVIQQPGNAGITVRFSANHAFNVGDELEIAIGGVELSEFNGLIQLNNVPLTNVSRLGTGKSITPTELTIGSLNANFEMYESQLVTIKNATLSKSGGVTFSGDVIVSDGTGMINMYTDFTYATFRDDAFPTGVVQVTAIANQGGNQSAKQLNIRSKADVTGGTIITDELIDISALRAFFAGVKTNVPSGKSIRGIVISDVVASNITNKNIVIQQEGKAGILIRFTATNTFNLGDEIEVSVGGMELSEYQGSLQVNNVPNSNAKLISTGKSITPQLVTIAELNANIDNFESELVKITNVTISKTSGTTYLGSVDLNDGSGTIASFTTTYAIFKDKNFPTGVVTLVGIAGQGGTSSANQVNIRNESDVQ